jgi:hypothetical protein
MAKLFVVKLSPVLPASLALFPIAQLTAGKIKLLFDKVLSMLNNVGYIVIVISMDNAACNRRFFIDLCDGKLKTCLTRRTLSIPVYPYLVYLIQHTT